MASNKQKHTAFTGSFWETNMTMKNGQCLDLDALCTEATLDFHVLCSFTGGFSHCQFYWVLCRSYFCPVWVGHVFQDCVFFLRNFLFASYKWVAIRTGYAAFLIFRLARNCQTLMPETSPTKESLRKTLPWKSWTYFQRRTFFVFRKNNSERILLFFVVFSGIFFSNVTLSGAAWPEKKESQEKGVEPCRLPETGVVQLSSFRPGGCLLFAKVFFFNIFSPDSGHVKW